MTTSISKDGRIELPAAMRRRDRVKPGQEFTVERLGPGKYQFTRAREAENMGLVDLLLACPVKDWYSPSYK